MLPLAWKVLRPDIAKEAEALYLRLADYYTADKRPQYYVLVSTLCVLDGLIRQALTEMQEKGVQASELLVDEKITSNLRALLRTVREYVAQLQRHTESIKHDYMVYAETWERYVDIVVQVATEFLPTPEMRNQFHRQLAEKLAAEVGNL